MLWALALFVVAISLEALTHSPFLATRFGILLGFCLGARQVDVHLYEVSALPAFGFRAAAQTWGDTVLVTSAVTSGLVTSELAAPGSVTPGAANATLAHEACHVAQYRRYTSFGFWLRYFGEWMVGLVRTRDLFRAYFEISLEQEAHAAHRSQPQSP